jgi:hypothetical protein
MICLLSSPATTRSITWRIEGLLDRVDKILIAERLREELHQVTGQDQP